MENSGGRTGEGSRCSRRGVLRMSGHTESISRAWVGPFRIRDLLAGSTDDGAPFPPDASGLYLVSVRSWRVVPDADCGPLYVGSNTGRSRRFRTRVGDLLADMFGFFGGGTGHHSGGRSLFRYCLEHGISPSDLHLAWRSVECSRCEEVRYFNDLQPRLNRNRPPRCRVHGS